MNDTHTRLMDREEVTASADPRKLAEQDGIRGRFADRTKRLARRQESDVFRHYLMPLTWIMALAGFLGLIGLWVAEGIGQMAVSPSLPVFALLFGTPGLTALLRAVRGHFHSAVRNL